MTDSPAGRTLAVLAAHCDARLVGDSELTITGLATLPGAVILHPDFAADYDGNALVHSDPYLCYARLTELFAPAGPAAGAVHGSAVIASDASVADDASIGANAVVETGAVIESGAQIGAGSFIGAGSRIGRHTVIHPHATIYHDVHLGARCIIHSQVVIGSDGFGFARDGKQWIKIHQLGGVRIGDDVELGAGTCVDRGALSHTVIEAGVKTDNMVQIAHNVRIGSNTVIAGCSAVAGSTEIGANCMIAGAVGIVGHLRIADGVTITAMSLVTKSINEPGSYSSGTPLEPSRQWRRNAVRFSQLESMAQRLKKLEKDRD